MHIVVDIVVVLVWEEEARDSNQTLVAEAARDCCPRNQTPEAGYFALAVAVWRVLAPP